MRALMFREGMLEFCADHAVPEPIEGEALVRVVLAGICNTDVEIVKGYMDFDGVLGHEFVGVVEEIYGEEARKKYGHLQGRRVVGDINAACYSADCWYCQRGMHTHCPARTTLGIVKRDGAFADYLRLPVENLYSVPDAVSDEEAVFVEPLAANFEILEQMHLQPTDRIVILGDGKMGQLAVQVLRLSGCELAMVGKHQDKLELAKRYGATTYLLETLAAGALPGGVRSDYVVECTGSAQGLEMAMRFVRPRGTIILKSTVADRSTLDLAPLVIDEIQVRGSRCGPFAPALRALERRLIDVKALISARYTLNEGLEAFTYAQKSGVLKVLVRV